MLFIDKRSTIAGVESIQLVCDCEVVVLRATYALKVTLESRIYEVVRRRTSWYSRILVGVRIRASKQNCPDKACRRLVS